MTKTGWWSVNFECTLEGETVSFDELDECSQEHILNLIKDGYSNGEIVEEDDEETDDEEYIPSSTNGDYSPSNPWDAPGMSMSDFI